MKTSRISMKMSNCSMNGIVGEIIMWEGGKEEGLMVDS